MADIKAITSHAGIARDMNPNYNAMKREMRRVTLMLGTAS